MRAAAIQLVWHARRRTKLGGRAHIDAQRSQADARGRMSVRVARTHQGEHVVATVHGDDITIGGERSAVELLIRKKISRKYEIKKQMKRVGEY